MLSQSKLIRLVLGLALVAAMHGDAFAQRGPGYGRGAGFRGGRGPGQGGDPQFAIDRDVFHFLLAHHEEIDRIVKKTKNGIETVTESDNPEIAAKIQEHVNAMYDRVKQVKPIHMRDPLFAELFRNAKKIKMKHEDTEKGVKVIETSKDPYVVKLLQAHADTVSLFIKNGFAEAQRNHAVPGADDPVPVSVEDKTVTAGCAGCPNAATCPSAKNDAGCAGCPNAATCPSAKKDAGCAGCPNAATCPSAKKSADAEKCPLSDVCPLADKCPGSDKCPLEKTERAAKKKKSADKKKRERSPTE